MAASRFIEEETGSYTGQIRHPHNGYYAGDFFSQTSRPALELRVSQSELRDVPLLTVRAHRPCQTRTSTR